MRRRRVCLVSLTRDTTDLERRGLRLSVIGALGARLALGGMSLANRLVDRAARRRRQEG